jgi:hypothetical protein
MNLFGIRFEGGQGQGPSARDRFYAGSLSSHRRRGNQLHSVFRRKLPLPIVDGLKACKGDAWNACVLLSSRLQSEGLALLSRLASALPPVGPRLRCGFRDEAPGPSPANACATADVDGRRQQGHAAHCAVLSREHSPVSAATALLRPAAPWIGLWQLPAWPIGPRACPAARDEFLPAQIRLLTCSGTSLRVRPTWHVQRSSGWAFSPVKSWVGKTIGSDCDLGKDFNRRCANPAAS